MWIAITPPEHTLFDLLKQPIEGLGYHFVQIRYKQTAPSLLQIMLDRADAQPITVEDCEIASRAISAILDVEDPIKEAYSLEVGSAGIDRPLNTMDDLKRHIGYEVRITTHHPVAKRKRFTGRLTAVNETACDVTLPESTTPVTIPYTAITVAKLQLTDALIAAHAAQQPSPESH